jgi:hypothetical protein
MGKKERKLMLSKRRMSHENCKFIQWEDLKIRGPGQLPIFAYWIKRS